MRLCDIPIKKKLLISSLACCLVPMLILMSILFFQFFQSFFRNITSMLEISVNQLEGNLNTLLLKQKATVQEICESRTIVNFVNSSYHNNTQSFQDYQNAVMPFLQPYLSPDRKVRVYSDNPSFRFSSIFTSQISTLRENEWYDLDAMRQSHCLWRAYAEKSSEGKLICYSPSYDAGKLIMVTAVILNEESLAKLFKEEYKTGRVVFLYDETGRIITSTKRSMICKDMETLKQQNLLPLIKTSDESVITFENRKYLAFSHAFDNEELEIDGWGLLYLIPYDDIISELVHMIEGLLLLFAMLLLVVVATIQLISYSITSRLGILMSKIRKVSAGKFEVSEQVGGDDEIGRIDRTFDSMLKQINNLIESVYQYRIRALDTQVMNQQIEMERKEAVILALQSQINPHYLYNTLETIRMKLILNKDDQTAQVVQLFAESFREYMKEGEEYLTLGQEIAFIRKYIIIQQFRFDDRIRCEFFIDDSLYEIKIPRLILQPLVENAVYHGLEPKLGIGTVIVEASVYDEFLYLKVTDDGIGMDEDELADLRAKMNQNVMNCGTQNRGTARIGLRNVQKRIELLYGSDCTMTITSKKGFGTEVELKLRVECQKERED